MAWKLTFPIFSYALLLASPRVGPQAATVRTRPPSVSTWHPSPLPASLVPAWKTWTSASTSLEPTNGEARAISRGVARPKPPRRPHRRLYATPQPGSPPCPEGRATTTSSRSVSRRGSTTWVSGSPRRQLNSRTVGALGCEHQPGVEHSPVRCFFFAKRPHGGRHDVSFDGLLKLGRPETPEDCSYPSRRCFGPTSPSMRRL